MWIEEKKVATKPGEIKLDYFNNNNNSNNNNDNAEKHCFFV